MLQPVVIQVLKIIHDDEDREVVMVAFETLAEMLSTIKAAMLSGSGDNLIQLSYIVESVISAFQQRVGFIGFCTCPHHDQCILTPVMLMI